MMTCEGSGRRAERTGCATIPRHLKEGQKR